MKVKMIILLLGISISSPAQKKDNCDCLTNLKEVITDIESNYPGYNLKTGNGKLAKYIYTKKRTIGEAAKMLTREDCFYVIERYIGYFGDNHIIFDDRKTLPSNPAVPNIPSIPGQDKLTGIWRRSADSLTIHINKIDASNYSAYTIKQSTGGAKTGQVHFKLMGNENEFRIRRYSDWLTTALKRGRRLGSLLIEPEGIWQRIVPGGQPQVRQGKIGSANKVLNYQMVNDDTFYLGIPAFNMDERKFDSLVVNQMIPEINMRKTKHLVIDLRDNVGGNSAFLSLVRLVYDGPFTIPGDFLYASPSLIDIYQKAADKGSASHKKLLPKLIANQGGFIQKDSLRVKISQSLAYPKRISIIVNENCASSTEYFLILAKHSAKVKIFGRHTSGTLDYSELLSPQKLSCAGYTYIRPTSKAFYTDVRLIDNKGIIPDVDLSSYPDDQWVERVVIGQFPYIFYGRQ